MIMEKSKEYLQKEKFFADLDRLHLSLTFDDVRLKTRYYPEDYDPNQAPDLSTHFSKNIKLKLPFVSAAMSTVTESDMAIAMAKEGGLGIIHNAMDIDKQKKELRKVKKYVNSLIEKPIIVQDDWSIEQLLNYCNDKNFNFTTFPVVDQNENFVGMLTNNNLKYELDESKQIKDIFTPLDKVIRTDPKISSEDAFLMMKKHKTSTLPVIDLNNKVVGLYLWSDLVRIHHEKSNYNVNEKGQLIVGAAISSGTDYLERIEEIKNYTDLLVIDSADGDSKFVVDALIKVKENYPNIDVVVGNISEGESALKLAEIGADGIKVGQGPGSICTTRIETGIGTPQVSAIYNCFSKLNEKYSSIPICGDGGIRDKGDISIAIASGASSVMMGRVLAGVKESPGKVISRPDGSQYKEYYGMGSRKSFDNNPNSKIRYNQTDNQVLIEGVESIIPYQGELKTVLNGLVMALKKSMIYLKTKSIEEHRYNTNFTRITNSGLRESGSHDVNVIGI